MDEPLPPPDGSAGDPVRRNALDRVIDLGENLSGLLIWAGAIAITVNVVLRRTLNIDFSWLFEITEYALLVIAFIGGPALLRQRGHVGVDLVGEVILPNAKDLVIKIGDVISVVILAALAGISAYMTYRMFLTGQLTTGVLQIPRWWVYAVIPVGFSLMTAQGIRNASHAISGRLPTE